MSVNPKDEANNQGVPSKAEIKAAKKKEEAAAKKAEKETTKEDVAAVRTVGWEAEQARLEKEKAEAVNEKPAVKKFKGHKLEDRLDSEPGEETAASDK